MNTTEKNEIIAEFIGLELFKNLLSSLHNGKISLDIDIYKQCKFDTDWNWLMSVVEKIESLGYTVTIAGVMCKVTKVLDIENSIVSYVLGDKSRKLELVYITIVDFIKWYNENNNA